MAADIWIVLTDIWITPAEGVPGGAEVWPFSTEEAATAKAREVAIECAARSTGAFGDVEEVAPTPDMRKDGWVLYLTYGPGFDRVIVAKRKMDGI